MENENIGEEKGIGRWKMKVGKKLLTDFTDKHGFLFWGSLAVNKIKPRTARVEIENEK